jgi:hypothetical protein
MARRKGRLEAKGFERVEGSAARRYIDPSGKEVSYREAFRRATGRSLEVATEERGGTGSYRELFRLARQVRTAAQNGLLSDAGLADRRQEQALASKTLRQMTRGHGESTATKAALRGREPERTSLFSRLVLQRLQADIVVERRSDESFSEYMNRVRAARYSKAGQAIVGPTSDKAKLLVVLNRRAPEAEYSVGDTP